jgi:hypothetical protein
VVCAKSPRPSGRVDIPLLLVSRRLDVVSAADVWAVSGWCVGNRRTCKGSFWTDNAAMERSKLGEFCATGCEPIPDTGQRQCASEQQPEAGRLRTDLFLAGDPVALYLAGPGRWARKRALNNARDRNEPAGIAGGVLLPRGGHGLDCKLMNVVLDQGVRESDAWSIHGRGRKSTSQRDGQIQGWLSRGVLTWLGMGRCHLGVGR